MSPSWSISGYVPFFNNATTVVAAVESLSRQDACLLETLAISDGSTDDGTELLEQAGVWVLGQPGNLGRGAARARAMDEVNGELVVCCDATNVLPQDFVRRLLPWFSDPKVAAVYGRIQDRNPRGSVGRWRRRHLFKSECGMETQHKAPLITGGALVRRSAIIEVGNFDPALRHSEDIDLGERLLAAGYDVVFDPNVPVFCNVQNTLVEVLDRYWRWYAGKDEVVSWGSYRRNVVLSIKSMAWEDLRRGDPLAALISLICPHYQFWKSHLKMGRRRRSKC